VSKFLTSAHHTVFTNTPPSRQGRYRLGGAIEEEYRWRYGLGLLVKKAELL